MFVLRENRQSLELHVRTAGFAARQMQDGGLDALAGRRGVGSSRPAEVTERSHGFTGEVVGGEPVVVHDGEGQTGEAVSVLLRTDVAGGQGGIDQRAHEGRTPTGGGGTHK